RLLGGSATHLHYLGERLSGERLERVVLEGNKQNAVGAAGGDVEVLPVFSRRANLVLDAPPQRRFPKSTEPRAKAALLHPRRHACVETGRARGVRVHVGADVESSGAGSLDALDDRRKLRPVRRAGLLQVIDLAADLGSPRDLDQLVDRFDEAFSFVAQMGDVR